MCGTQEGLKAMHNVAVVIMPDYVYVAVVIMPDYVYVLYTVGSL